MRGGCRGFIEDERVQLATFARFGRCKLQFHVVNVQTDQSPGGDQMDQSRSFKGAPQCHQVADHKEGQVREDIAVVKMKLPGPFACACVQHH